MNEMKKVLQIMPADNYWVVYKCNDEDVCFYNKVFFFVLVETVDNQGHAYQSVEPIDSFESFFYLNDGSSIYDSANFISLIYSEGLHKGTCQLCSRINYNCNCENKETYEQKFISAHKANAERKKV